MSRIKILPIVLPPSTYRRLEQEARAAERDPLQQARWILKQALAGEAGALPTTGSREPEAVAR